MKSLNNKEKIHEALEKDLTMRYTKRDKKRRLAMKVSGASVKKLRQIINHKSKIQN